MPKKHVTSNKGKRLSYDGAETSLNIKARPNSNNSWHVKVWFHRRRTNIGEE